MGEEDLRYRASDTSISPNASLVLWRFCERGCAELVPGVISVSLGQSCAKSGSGSNTRLWTVLRGIVVAVCAGTAVVPWSSGLVLQTSDETDLGLVEGPPHSPRPLQPKGRGSCGSVST